MARPLRILLAGGWYHVVARGNNRNRLFRDDQDHQRFLALVSELPERFGVEIHAFVLMANHYHLLLRTPKPNLSEAIRWLNVSHSVWHNWRHRQTGHVFQGRFKAQLIEDEPGVIEVARYIHLNPVRNRALGLDKSALQRQKTAAARDPGQALVAARLRCLTEFRWSSWRVYGGADPCPKWLDISVIGSGCGGKGKAAQKAALKKYTETPLREGHLESPWSRLVGGLVLGSEAFAQKILKGQKVHVEEQTEARRLRKVRADWNCVVAAAELALGRKWGDLLAAHGDWGRDGTVYVAVHRGGMRLPEVLPYLPGLKYQALAQGIKRFKSALATDPQRRKFVSQIQAELSKNLSAN